LILKIKIEYIRQPFHGGNTSSILVRVINDKTV